MVDGYNIMCLVATMFYVLMPDFIKEKRLCWLRAPLYGLSKGSQKIYAYTDEELKELSKGRENWEQSRYKGLGECSPARLAGAEQSFPERGSSAPERRLQEPARQPLQHG